MNTNGPRYPKSHGAEDAEYHCSIGVFDVYTQQYDGFTYTHLIWGNENGVDSGWIYYDGERWDSDIKDAPTEDLDEALEFGQALYNLIV